METKIQNPFETLCAQLSRIEALVLELKTEIAGHKSTGEHNDEGVYLAMEVTGLAKKTIYNLVSRRKIPHYKKGGRLYFDKQELTEWKRSGKHLALNEIGQDPLDQFPLRRTRRGKQL